jgi:sphingolipid C9-methyltransferase
MLTEMHDIKAPEIEIDFIDTPDPAPQAFNRKTDCGVNIISVRITLDLKSATKDSPNRASCFKSPSITDGVLPADGPGAEGFSNLALLSLLIGVPSVLSLLLNLTWLLTVLTALLTLFPLLASFWYLSSSLTYRKNEKVKLPGRPVESYLNFLKKSDREKYKGQNKIPIDTFQTLYFDGNVEFKGHCLEVLEYRHDWASFHFTLNIFKFFLFSFVPEVIMHTRSQGDVLFHRSLFGQLDMISAKVIDLHR